ncbi:MAG: tripartite tricarboxylate transporter substrate binding protein [Pseudomonadota bacterium]
MQASPIRLKCSTSIGATFLYGILASVFAFACQVAFGQPYPARPIRLVVPFPAGGGVDISARLVGQKLAERLGGSVVVDNRSGAAGIIGTGIVARAQPDGYTLGMVAAGHTINPGLYPRLPYDAVKDFAPISLVVLAPGILVVGLNVRARTAMEFIELARAKPGQMTFSSAGTGSPPHLAMELLKTMMGIDLIHVPYKGGAEYMADVAGGRIDATITSIAAVLPLVKSSRVRALAVSSRTRAAATPDVSTMIEAGVRGYEAVSWYGLLAPAGTPRGIVERLSAETVRVLRMDDVRERLIGQGLEPVGNTPQELAARIGEEIPKWNRVIQAAGIRIE